MAQHLSGPPDLNGQVAFITGGAGDIGKAIANTFREAGATVIVTDVAEQAEVGPSVQYKQYDVTSREQTDSVIDAVLAEHGKIDVLVLCAGNIARPIWLTARMKSGIH